MLSEGNRAEWGRIFDRKMRFTGDTTISHDLVLALAAHLALLEAEHKAAVALVAACDDTESGSGDYQTACRRQALLYDRWRVAVTLASPPPETEPSR